MEEHCSNIVQTLFQRVAELHTKVFGMEVFDLLSKLKEDIRERKEELVGATCLNLVHCGCQTDEIIVDHGDPGIEMLKERLWNHQNEHEELDKSMKMVEKEKLGLQEKIRNLEFEVMKWQKRIDSLDKYQEIMKEVKREAIAELEHTKDYHQQIHHKNRVLESKIEVLEISNKRYIHQRKDLETELSKTKFDVLKMKEDLESLKASNMEKSKALKELKNIQERMEEKAKLQIQSSDQQQTMIIQLAKENETLKKGVTKTEAPTKLQTLADDYFTIKENILKRFDDPPKVSEWKINLEDQIREKQTMQREITNLHHQLLKVQQEKLGCMDATTQFKGEIASLKERNNQLQSRINQLDNEKQRKAEEITSNQCKLKNLESEKTKLELILEELKNKTPDRRKRKSSPCKTARPKRRRLLNSRDL